MGLQTRPYSGCDSVSTPYQPNIPIMFDWAGETAVLRQEEPRLSLGSESASHAARGSVAKTPYFPETISCLPLITGETGDSGHSPSCDDNGKKTTFPNEFRESPSGHSRFAIRADNGRFRDREVSRQPLLRREVLCAIPIPLFLGKISCLAGFLGEIGGSGRNQGFDRRAKRREV